MADRNEAAGLARHDDEPEEVCDSISEHHAAVWFSVPEESDRIMETRAKKSRMRLFCGAAGLVIAALSVSGCGYFSPQAKEARFLDAGKKALAKKEYARAVLQFRNAASVMKADAEPYYQAALAYLALGNYQLAGQALRKALQLNPRHQQAQIKMAELLRATGQQENIEEAETRIRGVLAVSPGDSDALNALALTEWDRGKRAEAAQYLAQAIAQSPQNLQAAKNLAQLKLLENDVSGAEKILQKAAAENPKNAAPLVLLGNLYSGASKTDAAEQQYRLALRLEPQNVHALVKLAELYVKSQRTAQAEEVYREISALPNPEFRASHAMFLLESGKLDQAIVELEGLAKRTPNDREIRNSLVEAYFRANRISDAEKLLTEALQKNGKDIDAMLQRSRIYLMVGSYDDAEKDLMQVLRFRADSAPAHYLMGKIRQRKGAFAAARQEFSEALRFKPDLLPARLDEARVLLANNDARAALELLDLAPGYQKTLLPLIVLRNWALFGLNEISSFRKGVNDALAIERTPDALLQDAIVQLQQREIAAARASIDEALTKNPRDIRALDLLVTTYRIERRPDGVLPKLRAVTDKYPTSAEARTILGDWLLASGDRAGARAAFSAAITLQPHYVTAVVGLARADAADGKLEDARKALTAMAELEPRNATVTLLMGNVEERAGNLDKALGLYLKVLQLDAGNVEALNNTAYLLASYAHKPDEALPYAQRAKELAPDNGAIDDTLGWVLYQKGLYSEAVPHLEKASTRMKQAVAQYHLSMAYFKAGDRVRGSQALQSALQRDPKAPEAAYALRVQAEARRATAR